MKPRIIATALWLCGAAGRAAASIYFPDATGLTSPFLGEKSMFDSSLAAGITSDKDKAQLTYINENLPTREMPDHTKVVGISNDAVMTYFTIGAEVTASNGLATLLKNGGASPEFTGSFGYGWRNVATRQKPTLLGRRVAMDWITVRGSIKRANYKLFNGTAPFAAQVQTERFKGGGVEASYAVFIDGGFVAVASTGYSRVNNYDDLDKVNVDDIIQTSADPQSTATRQVSKQTAARVGTYKNQNLIPVQASLTRYPGQKGSWGIGESAFIDAGWKDSHFVGSIGIGAFLARGTPDKPEVPLDAIIGLTLKADKLWGDPKNHSFSDKLTVAIQTTVTFF